MIEFTGTSEQSWLIMQGHRVKDIMKRLREHRKNNPRTGCPLTSSKKG